MDDKHPFPFPSHDGNLPNKPQKHPVSPFLSKQRKQLFKLGGIVVLILLLFSVIAYWVGGSRRSTIVIQTGDTKGLTITLNDRPTKPRAEKRGLVIQTYPGQYRLKISKSEYLPFVQDILLEKKQTVILRPAFALIPKANRSDNTTTVDYVRPSLDHKALFYLGDNRQRVYRMEIANRVPVPITDKPLRSVSDIRWSGEPDVALITTPDSTYLLEIPKYDLIHQDMVRIGGSEIVSPIWDPSNPERMAFAYFPATGEKSLVFSDKKLSSLDRKTDLTNIKNPKLIWSNNANYILVLDRSMDVNQNNLWLYNTTNGAFNQITTEGNILDATFSPDSNHILYEKYAPVSGTPYTSTLHLINPDGTGRQDYQTRGKVSQAAWKDNESFFLPDLKHNTLIINNLNGQTRDLSFSFDDPNTVSGMFYFAASQVLIFYTNNAIYHIGLGN